jgi:hypothetical protein
MNRRTAAKVRLTYERKAQYTEAELQAAIIADLETDIRCAERDGLHEYAAKCRRALAVEIAKAEGR